MEAVCAILEIRIPKSLVKSFLQAEVMGDIDVGKITLVVYSGEAGKSAENKPGEYFQFISNFELSRELFKAVIENTPAVEDHSHYTYRLESVIPVAPLRGMLLSLLQLIDDEIYEIEIANLHIVEGGNDPDELLDKAPEMVMNQDGYMDVVAEFTKCKYKK